MEPISDASDIPGVVGRRSARLSIIVPVTVRGTDASGEAFKENTWTISVNKHGGRIATFHQLGVDDQLVIENPLLGRTAKARVIRVCEKRFAEDPYEVCVELLEAQNVWGVKLPPEDWQGERQIAPGESSTQAEPQAQETPAATTEKAGEVEKAPLAPGGSPAEVGEHTGGLSQFNMAVNALSRLAGEAIVSPAQPALPRQDVLGVPKASVGPSLAPDELALKSLQEKMDEAAALSQELSVLANRLQSARAEVENLLPKATLEFQDQCKRTAEQARAELDELLKEATTAADVRIRKVVEESSPALSAAIERSVEQAARQQLEDFKAQIESARRSSEESLQHNLERMRQEVQAETLSAGIQARKIYKEESGTAAKAISVCVDSAVDLLNRAGDEAAAKLQASRQVLELGLKKAAEECLPRLAGESASLLEKFRAEAQAFAAQLQSEVEPTAREFWQKARGEMLEKLEASAEGALEKVARDFNKQAEDTLELLKEGLQSAREQCLEEAQKQLAAARQATLTSLESEAGANSAAFREQLQATLREMLSQQTKEMETGMQTRLQGLLESLRSKIQLTADETAAQVTTQVSSRVEQALQELEDRLYKGVGMAALAAKEWEEQAKTHLEAHSRQLLELSQKQLEALTVAAEQRQRSDAAALAGLLQGRLSQAARLFEGLETHPRQPKGATLEESGNAPSPSPRPSADSVPPALEPQKEKQSRVFEEALDAFRSKLNQTLAGHTPKE